MKGVEVKIPSTVINEGTRKQNMMSQLASREHRLTIWAEYMIPCEVNFADLVACPHTHKIDSYFLMGHWQKNKKFTFLFSRYSSNHPVCGKMFREKICVLVNF